LAAQSSHDQVVCITQCKKENYTAVAIHMIIKSMAEISPSHKVYTNVTPGKHFYSIQNVL